MITVKHLSILLIGRTEIIFQQTEQLLDPSQTRMIEAINQFLDRTNGLGQQTIYELLDTLEQRMNKDGLASFTPLENHHPGDIARPRRYEIAAVLNRMRTAKVSQK